MTRPQNPNTPNVERMFALNGEMIALMRLWDASPSRRLSVPFDTRGAAINVRLNFHIWRKEALVLFATDYHVAMARDVLCKRPFEFEGKWYLEFVRRGDSDLAQYLRGQGQPPVAEPPLRPTPMPPAAVRPAPAPPTDSDEPDEEGLRPKDSVEDLLRGWLNDKEK